MSIALLAALAISTASFADEVVQQDDHGSWVSYEELWADGDTPDQVYQEQSVWVDFLVPNWSYHKDCGIVWTTDGWTDRIGWAEAWYEGTLDDGRERWGVDLEHIVDFHFMADGETNHDAYDNGYVFEYAIYYTVGGVTYWDNNGGENYRMLLLPDDE